MMTPDQISKVNSELRNKSPLEIVKWAIAQANGRAIVSNMNWFAHCAIPPERAMEMVCVLFLFMVLTNSS